MAPRADVHEYIQCTKEKLEQLPNKHIIKAIMQSTKNQQEQNTRKVYRIDIGPRGFEPLLNTGVAKDRELIDLDLKATRELFGPDIEIKLTSKTSEEEADGLAWFKFIEGMLLLLDDKNYVKNPDTSYYAISTSKMNDLREQALLNSDMDDDALRLIEDTLRATFRVISEGNFSRSRHSKNNHKRGFA